jgi:hypothetical protein
MQENSSVICGHFKSRNKTEAVPLLLIEEVIELARRQGFVGELVDDLTFEPWLVYDGYSAFEYSGNVAAIEFDPSALYFAKVSGPLYPNPYVIAFGVKANFSVGEIWRFDVTVHYINNADEDGPECATFDAIFYGLEPFVVTITPGEHCYDMTLSGGLSIDFLKDDMLLPLHGLASLIAMQAISVNARPMS